MSNNVLILGPAASSYVRTARMICVEKRVPHALEPVELGSDAHGALHPWKRVPILRHGDVQLIETAAIAHYLDAIGDGPALVPTNPVARATMEQWISVINCYLYDTLVQNYALQYIVPKLRGREPDLEAIRAGVPAMQRDVARLDGAYAGRAWIAGDALSLADLFVAPIVQTVGLFPEGKAALAKAPNVSRAFRELAKRESFAVAHAGLAG